MTEEHIQKMREYFKNQGITQKQIAKDINVSANCINMLFVGKRKFGKETAMRFHDVYGFSILWLMTGKGDMIERVPSENKVLSVDYVDNSQSINELISILRKQIAEKDTIIAMKDAIIETKDAIIKELKMQ